MFIRVKAALGKWLRNFHQPEELAAPPLSQLVEQAKEQWHQARAYFQYVKEPELVDYAINNLEAAEKRYDYLLKQLRGE